jgi:hypothetical protein
VASGPSCQLAAVLERARWRETSDERETARSVLRKRLDDGPGHADMEALRVIDAAAAETIHHVLIGDKFRHGLFPHTPGDPDDRLDDELVDDVCAKATNEVAIDFEIVEGEMLQIKERAKTGAKIVQREPAPSTLQLRRELLRMVDVANRRRFGQFEDETRGVDARVRERSIDDRDELRIADGLC